MTLQAMPPHTRAQPAPRLRVPPSWARLFRRLMALRNGRYAIIISVADGVTDWTVQQLGDVEQ